MSFNHMWERAISRALFACAKFFEFFAKWPLTPERRSNRYPPPATSLPLGQRFFGACLLALTCSWPPGQKPGRGFCVVEFKLPRCLTCVSEERETWTAVSLRMRAYVRVVKRPSTVTLSEHHSLLSCREAVLLESECVRDSSRVIVTSRD